MFWRIVLKFWTKFTHISYSSTLAFLLILFLKNQLHWGKFIHIEVLSVQCDDFLQCVFSIIPWNILCASLLSVLLFLLLPQLQSVLWFYHHILALPVFKLYSWYSFVCFPSIYNIIAVRSIHVVLCIRSLLGGILL